MLANYFPVLLFIIIGLVAGGAFITLGSLLAPSRPYEEKNSPYECGFEAFENARMRFDVRYYLVLLCSRNWVRLAFGQCSFSWSS